MKCHILFSGKNKKNISKCRLLKILPRVLSVKDNLHSLPHQNVSCEYSLERSINMIYSGVKIIQN